MRFDKVVISLVYILCMFAMISDYKVLSNAVGLATTLITILYILVTTTKRDARLERQTNVYIFLFFAYFIFTSLINFNPNKWGVTLMVYIMVFTPYFLYAYILKSHNIRFAQYLVRGFFVIWTIFLILCFWTSYTIPDLARMMAADRASFYNIINGGGYFMGFGSSIFATYLYKRLIRGDFQGIWKKGFILFEIILMIATVWVINSYVTLIALVAGLVIVTLNRITKTTNMKFISYSFVGIMLLLFYVFSEPILTYLINNTSNEFWNYRLVETYESVFENDNSSHVDERERVYRISVDGFLQSPIFGTGYKNGNTFDSEGMNNVGNHSTILDSLAQFGIIGSIPLFMFLLYPWRRTRVRGGDWEYMVPFFIMACLNPVLRTYHVMVIIFLIIPCMDLIKYTIKFK